MSINADDKAATKMLPFFKPFVQTLGLFKLVLKRQRHHVVLSLLSLLGIVLAVGLVTNASFFSQAVDRVILNQKLTEFTKLTGRPPFSTSVYIFPSQSSPLTLEASEKLSGQIGDILSTEIGLPLKHSGLQVSSGSLMMQTTGETGQKEFLGSAPAMYVAGISSHITILDGKPLDEGGESADIPQVWIHDQFAQKMGVHLGEKLQVGVILSDNPLTIQIAGFWKSKDTDGSFWFSSPDSSLNQVFLLRRNDYIKFIQPLIASGTREVDWYIVLDETKAVSKNGSQYLNGFQSGRKLIARILPEVQLNTPPLEPLKEFVDRSLALTLLLLGYNLPAFGILLYFLLVISTIIARWQRRETSVLMSRGMSVGEVLNLTVIEELLLFVIGYPVGILLGMLIARVIGYCVSFLSFTGNIPLPVTLQGISLPLTFLALGVSLFSRLSSAIQATRQSVVTEEHERARPTKSPFWYRYYIDILLLLPTLYFYDQISKRGSIAGLIVNKPEDLYQDPLLILVPAIFIITISLLTMRAFTLIVKLVDYLASLSPWVSLHLGLRQLARQGPEYISPLLLVIVSLALGIYTLSMAASLDKWLNDRVYYQDGADLTFTPAPIVEGTSYIDGNWIPEPAKFKEIPGVSAVTRVGDYLGEFSVDENSRSVRGRFIAVDRVEFPDVAWYRSDFSSDSLIDLMNQLALTPDGILVSEEMLKLSGLSLGSIINVSISTRENVRMASNFTIVGVYKYFPTVYESEDFAVIGNLEYLGTLVGFTLPHQIWMKLQPGASGETVLKLVLPMTSIRAEFPNDARANIAIEQAKMERVGIFGTLSIGFLSTAVMAILGLLLYSYASLQERAYRFAVLHAIGITTNQIIWQVAFEYAVLALFGALAGAFIGVFSSNLFIPFFRFTGQMAAALPPLLPIIARDQVRYLSMAFAGIIVVAEVLTITSVLRRQLISILKTTGV